MNSQYEELRGEGAMNIGMVTPGGPGYGDVVHLDAKPGTLEEYRALVTTEKCFCGWRFLESLTHYDHDGGFRVAGFDNKQWLYLVCSNPDYGHVRALWKLLGEEKLLREESEKAD